MSTIADKSIEFDNSGVCHHCRRYQDILSTRTIRGEAGKAILDSLVCRIKSFGSNKEYDCIIGVSGGVDSTYVAYLVRRLGLRPLAIHLDNGWDSELAVKNIEKILNHLGIDLYTYVIDWEEFRDLQVAFLKASTPDGEIPSDHAIFSVLWREAARRNIKYIISGMNFTTEAIYVPDWAYGHSDWKYIKDVHNKFGTQKIRTFPHFSLFYLFYITLFRRIKTVSILNYVDYDKNKVMHLLKNELGWKYYGSKHHESIYTRFYQGYVLPKKFGIDKRYGHLSDLINSGQISRQDALEEIKLPPYSEIQQAEDLEYVIKKLRLKNGAFDEIMALDCKTFRDYKNSFYMVNLLKKTANLFRGFGLYPK
jgi:N-acetyl sugar amidotransferase